MGKIGEQLLQPEEGWRRYDDTDSNITYVGDWSNTLNSLFYNSSYYNISVSSSFNERKIICKFNFTGTKLRIISSITKWRSKNIIIKIDDLEERYGENNLDETNNTSVQKLVYEKIGLINKEHFVEIYIDSLTTIRCGDNLYKSVEIDAIDIDIHGTLKPYNENINKFLIQDNNNIYSFKTGMLEKVGYGTPTKQIFDNYGINIINDISKNELDKLTDNAKLIVFTEDKYNTNPKIIKEMELNKPFIKTLDKPKLKVYTDIPNYKPKVITNGYRNIPYDYKVDLLNPENEFKNVINVNYDIEDRVNIPSNIFKQALNPYNLKVTVTQEDGTIVSSDGQVTLYDTEPTLIVTVKGLTLYADIGDKELDLVKYCVKLNGKQIFPTSSDEFTPLIQSPIRYSKTFKSDEIKIGAENIIEVIAQDEFGKESKVRTSFIGDYAGLLFADEFGKYYATDLGKLLQYLDFGILICGQNSQIAKVYLKNKNGYKIKNISINTDNTKIGEGLRVELSKSKTPFIPLDRIDYSDTLDYNEQIEFYVRLSTELFKAKAGDTIFEIYAKAEPV